MSLITRDFLESLNFTVMSQMDRQAFAGCESPLPLSAENEKYLVIVDADYCEVYDVESDMMEPIETCESISRLPYSWE